MEPKSIDEIIMFFAGVREGLRAYAWWKAGVQYLGTTDTTLAEAISSTDSIELNTMYSFNKGDTVHLGGISQ